MKSISALVILLLANVMTLSGQSYPVKIEATVDPSVRANFDPDARLFLFFSKYEFSPPYTQIWPNGGNAVFGKNLHWAVDQHLMVSDLSGWSKTPAWNLEAVPAGTYYVQILWDQDQTESRIDAPGNLISAVKKVEINQNSTLQFNLNEVIPERTIIENPLVKYFEMTSDTLSAWWGKPVLVKASVLLPSGFYDHPDASYPVRYHVAGYGGRYTRINRVMDPENPFSSWWTSGDAPQIITIYLDGEGPFGDSYQLDSDNSGPYGYALTHELGPKIEALYRGAGTPKLRFVDGCSTGGWVSLALQLYYPDFFNGCWSYSPDAIEFNNYQLINIYKDKNAFTNEYGLERPVMRETSGEPMMLMREFINYENVQGKTDTYVTSGGQFSAHTALYSPKGTDGLPVPLFDPFTGDIDPNVAEHWKKYDLTLYSQENWTSLGPKVQGKLNIWMGDMDNFYLNLGTRAFDEFIQSTDNPHSDAVIRFTPMKGHCEEYDQRTILEAMAMKVKSITRD